jgi:hypothetical protein
LLEKQFFWAKLLYATAFLSQFGNCKARLKY